MDFDWETRLAIRGKLKSRVLQTSVITIVVLWVLQILFLLVQYFLQHIIT